MDDIRGGSLICLYSPSGTRSMLTHLQSISITSVLKTLRVSLANHQPLDDNAPEIPSIGCSNPPYVVVGWTSQPFLANVELSLTMLEVVQAKDKPSRVSHPVMGAEQVVDVELEKRMRVLPPRKDIVSINSKSLWATVSAKVETDNAKLPFGEQAKKDASDIDKLLNELVSKFPMTHKDIKSRGRVNLPQLPYMLVLSPDQFKALNLGRRKAIEGYPGCLQPGHTHETSRRLALSATEDGRCIHWLESKCLFIRGRPSRITSKPPVIQTKMIENEALDAWCGYCGLRLDDDASVQLLGRANNRCHEHRTLLKLPAFRTPHNQGPFPLDRLGNTVSEVDAQLAPYATIGLTLRPLIKILVGSALDVAKEDKHDREQSSGLLPSRDFDGKPLNARDCTRSTGKQHHRGKAVVFKPCDHED
ncbi:malate dehydrogenase [Salix suchowensis]|nr:malate dehydrogenase [Salix suchowensis]